MRMRVNGRRVTAAVYTGGATYWGHGSWSRDESKWTAARLPITHGNVGDL